MLVFRVIPLQKFNTDKLLWWENVSECFRIFQIFYVQIGTFFRKTHKKLKNSEYFQVFLNISRKQFKFSNF